MATIGTDPEFTIYKAGRVLAGREYFRDLVSARFAWGNIGLDGCGRPVEIRPNPSSRPMDVVVNVARLLQEAAKKLPSGAVFGVGSHVANIGGLGGHLHVWGRPTTRDKLDSPRSLSKICLGLSLLWALEDPATGLERRNQGYGGINDVRKSSPAKEFRSPSPDWLASPSLAYHTLSYFQTLVDRADSYGQEYDEMNDMFDAALKYWVSPERPAATYRAAYIDRVVNWVKPGARPKDLSAILFFAEKLPRLRDNPHRLVLLDVEKWGKKVCAD